MIVEEVASSERKQTLCSGMRKKDVLRTFQKSARPYLSQVKSCKIINFSFGNEVPGILLEKHLLGNWSPRIHFIVISHPGS